MLKIGFISTWHVHTDDYARQLLDSGKGEIRAVWDDDADRGRAWAERYGVPYIQDYGEFLKGDFAAVICNAPTTDHPVLLHRAVEAGKHIFTEKLLATNTADCEKLCNAIEESGIVFTISLPLRANPRMLYVKELIDKGLLGRVTGARMRRSHSGVSDGWLPERWFDVSKTGGGAMMDLGAHPVYMLAFLLGAPKRVSAMMTAPCGTSSDENAIALVEFENGVLGTCETGFVTCGVPDLLEVYGTEGSVFIHGDKVRVATKSTAELGLREVRVKDLPPAPASPLEQFVDACLKGAGSPAHLGAGDALVMTKMIESAYLSDKTDRTINL